MNVNIQASAPARELLQIDAREPYMRLAEHPVWQEAIAGRLPIERVHKLVLNLFPAVAGPGRYAFFAKVSQITAEDGAALFRRLHEANSLPEANADAGWRKIGSSLGISEAALDAALADPAPEAADFVDLVRERGLRSSAAEAAAVAWAIERQLPELWGRFADGLRDHYGVPEDALDYLRYETGRADEVMRWTDHLLETYLIPANPYTVYEARRAAREAVWGWTALTEAG